MITITSEYALRALVALAHADEGATLQARELAQMTQVPTSYLYKILTSLRHAGILAGSRGSHGGYCLSRAATDIHLIEIISLFEVVRPNDACLLAGSTGCDDTNPCTAHEDWKHVQHTFNDFMEARTIADLATSAPELRQQ